jgi:hypothetical protein
MKPQPCFETNKALEEASQRAEQRKNRAIDRLTEKLGAGCFEPAMANLINADKRALQEKRR